MLLADLSPLTTPEMTRSTDTLSVLMSLSKAKPKTPNVMSKLPQVYCFEMKRTATTTFEISASSEAEAIALYEELGDGRYKEELEQMNVEEEVVSIKKSANAPISHIVNISTKISEVKSLLNVLNQSEFSQDKPETAVLSEMMILLNQAFEIAADRRDEITNAKG